MAKLPKRTSDTMSDAIAASSPSGKTSRRAKDAARKRLSVALFGSDGLPEPSCPQPTEREYLLRKARAFRAMAAIGMRVRKYTKEADRLEQEAERLGNG